MENANMKWKPTQYEIITAKILPPDLNTAQNKWRRIQEHNSPENTPEQQQNTAQSYMHQLQEYNEQQATQELQIVKWTPPGPKKESNKKVIKNMQKQKPQTDTPREYCHATN